MCLEEVVALDLGRGSRCARGLTGHRGRFLTRRSQKIPRSTASVKGGHDRSDAPASVVFRDAG